jgi:hypothetical protein
MICKYNYQTKSNVVLEMYTEKLNAINNLFSIAASYIKEKDGIDAMRNIDYKSNKIINKVDLDYTANLPAGYYIVRDQQKDHFYKLEIWQKTVSYTKYYGVAKFKNHHWKHIFDLDLVELLFISSKNEESLNTDRQALAKTMANKYQNLDISKILRDASDNNLYVSVKHLIKNYPDNFKN